MVEDQRVEGASQGDRVLSAAPTEPKVSAHSGDAPSRWHKGRWLNPYHWPCRACGALEPTPEGHDPCIANLPGVDFACCGHGRQPGYVAFANGTVIRGEFEEFHGWPNPADAVIALAGDTDGSPKGPDRDGLDGEAATAGA